MKKTNVIPWWEPQLSKKGALLVQKVFQDNFPNEGSFTEEFEQKTASLLKVKYALAVTSGTAAMYLSLKAMGIGNGDEVIVPDVTFIATANAVEMTGAKAVLVDVDAKTLNMSPECFEKAITKKTKAVIPVHVSGRAANMTTISKIAKKHTLFVVEDAAEAFMSQYRGKHLGTIGDTGCFSFSAAKIITSGQGGLIVTSNEKLYRRLKELKDQGRPSRGTGGDDIHYSIGFNFKFTNLQAAVALGQLDYIRLRMKKMLKINALYRKLLKNVPEITIFDVDVTHGELPLWTDCIAEKRDELDAYLSDNGIHCRRFWFPIHKQKPYTLSDAQFPQSTRLSPKALWLPSAFTLSDKDIETVCVYIKDFYNKAKTK